MRHREQEDLRRHPDGFKPNYMDNVSTAGIDRIEYSTWSYRCLHDILGLLDETYTDASILSQRRRARCDWGWNLQPNHYATMQQWSKYLFISGFSGWSDWWKPTKNLLLYLTVHNICCLLSWVSGSCRVPRCQIICCLPYLHYNIHISKCLKCECYNANDQ